MLPFSCLSALIRAVSCCGTPESVFERLNANSNNSCAPMGMPEFKFDFGERKTFAVPPSERACLFIDLYSLS